MDPMSARRSSQYLAAAFGAAFGLLGAVGGAGCASSDGSGGSAGTGAGGTGAVAGDSGAGDASCAGKAEFFCAPQCGGDVIFGAICDNGQWRCPAGMVQNTDCPDDTCFGFAGFCCADDGSMVGKTCPGRGSAVCPPGTKEQTDPMNPCPYQPGCEASGCSTTEYCGFKHNSCGNSSPGTCKGKPTACPSAGPPACGCDGVVYANDCVAQQAGVDMGTACMAPPGMMPCGTRFCTFGVEYCRITVSAGANDLAECMPLPAGCTAGGDCACLANEPCGGQCSQGPMPKLSCTATK